VFDHNSSTSTVFPRLKFKQISNRHSPFEVFSRVYKEFNYSYLLESMEGPQKLAQYSFIGFNPQSIITVKNGEFEVVDDKEDVLIKEKVRNPFHRIRMQLRGNVVHSNVYRLIGGAVGYISYDAIRYWERLPEVAKDDLSLPDIELVICDDGIIFDHANQNVLYYYTVNDRSAELEEILRSAADIDPLKRTQPKTNISKECFEAAVVRAKEYIASGDILQVVLSKRYQFTISNDLLLFYKSLRRINPSPYMYFLKMGDKQIVGSSPEMLVRVENRVIETYPIAGTRPRVKDGNKNQALAKELLADPKERAEHLMLVDLARNDVGKVSEFGSVCVPQFMEVHEYSHVQHIVSRVTGKLRPKYDNYDAFQAIFPAGTVSGAPKIRAMEIIEEIEPTRRGPYAGAVGYFSFNGTSDFAITIRTLVAKGKNAYVQVGAGIVADSIPEREWFETDHKVQALIQALEASGEE
jgi:anthranilate synthase component 1